jgi:GNAT superfamily N-acetyltransferase
MHSLYQGATFGFVDTWASPYLAAQAEYLRHLGTAPAAESLERNGVYAVRTGIASNAENGVVSVGDVPVERELAADVIAWLSERNLPAAWVCAEGARRAETVHVLEALGCRPDRASCEMRGSLKRLFFDGEMTPAGIHAGAVASERDLDAWLDVATACGLHEHGERRTWRDLLLGLGFAPAAPIRLYVAFRGDRAVGMASAFYAGALALLTAVAVITDERRRGIGRAFALMRLHEARERGCMMAVLAPTPDGTKLYNALGFETHPQPPDRWFFLPTTTA